MKTKKSSDKKETKIKANKSLVLRNDSKVKQKSIQSSERLCNRCKVHGITVSFKGHECTKKDCLCVKCQDYIEKNRRRNEQNKQRLHQKKANKDNKSKDNSIVNSLKNKSKKILNSKKKDTNSAAKKKKKRYRTSGSGDGPPPMTHSIVNHMRNREEEDRSSPPRLILQRGVNETPIEALIDNNSSATDVDVNHSNPVDSQPVPEKSSAALCAQYLKACEGLSRKLSKYKLSEDELIASLKYFIVRQSLGDIERAANDIIFASQEIRLGASYIIQHPGDDLNHPSVGQTTSSIRHTAQPPVNSSAPQLLCSTMYPNFRSNDGHTYSPAFTPIRNNN